MFEIFSSVTTFLLLDYFYLRTVDWNFVSIAEAEAQIEGSKEKYLKYGSPLQLTCTVLKSPEVPTYIFWYHNNQMVNYDSHRGFNVTLDLANKTSSLYVARTTNQHTGNYSCVPSNAHPDSSVVHILSGKFENKLFIFIQLGGIISAFRILLYLKSRVMAITYLW